jgi:hypothetical protein
MFLQITAIPMDGSPFPAGQYAQQDSKGAHSKNGFTQRWQHKCQTDEPSVWQHE